MGADGEALRVQERDGGALFEVRVVPRAGRAGVRGMHGSALKIALCAPPVDGAANAALVALLAELLGVSKQSVAIAGGERSRSKRVLVHGVTAAQVRALL